MVYTEKQFNDARAIFEKKLIRHITPFNCPYCNNPGYFAHKHEGDKYFMHPDCFMLNQFNILSETPIDMLMGIGDNETPEVYFKKKVFDEIVSSAIDHFPSQYNYFLVGEIDNDAVEITGFKPVPIFEYPRPYGTFGHWEFRKGMFDGQKNKKLDNELEELEDLNIVGYLHAHSTRQISQSDLFYEYLYSMQLDDVDKEQFKIHIRLDNFYPVLKELVMINHNEFNGLKPLTESNGYGDVFTDHFEQWIADNKAGYHWMLKKAKVDAIEKIHKTPDDYSCAYTTIPHIFKFQADSILFEQLEDWLSKDILDVDAFANLELRKRIHGQIQRLPLEVKK
ncbi:MAG: hypothetical protein GQ477_05435 [Nanohaloarchaea archaeon]|nr:hypothetical protein [Candidatus Nanohaloarchaea archaeon]